MRINQKLYVLADEAEPIESQKFENREIQVFYMDQFEGVVEEYVHQKGQFAVWTSVDAINYRLFIERGYYDELKELYSAPVNKIWVEFWDTTDNITKKFTRFFMYPLMLIAVVLCVLSFVLPRVINFGDVGNNIFSYSIIGVLIALFIVMMVINSSTKKKITQENIKSRQKVMEIFGEENFNSLIDKQKNYMDDYFKNLYPVEEEEENTEEALEAPAEEEDTEVKEESEEVAEVKEESEEAAEVEVATEAKEEAEEATEEEKITE